jgi:hypothetical protein
MASPFARRLEEIVKGSLTPLLRSRGFRKEGSVYRLQRDSMTWLVDLQKSRWNDPQEAQFTLNGGVYIPGTVSVYTGRPEPEKPMIADCCLSVRVGMLDESRRDKWWKVTARDDPRAALDESIAEDVCGHVGKLLLPFLERFRSVADVAEFLDGTADVPTKLFAPQAAAQRHAYASLIYLTMGDRTKAHREIEQAMCDAKGSPIEGVVERLREHVSSRRA